MEAEKIRKLRIEGSITRFGPPDPMPEEGGYSVPREVYTETFFLREICAQLAEVIHHLREIRLSNPNSGLGREGGNCGMDQNIGP